MSISLWSALALVVGLTSCELCYAHGHHGYGGSVIIISQPGFGYYNSYYPYNYPYYYYPRYRCQVVPRCYPSGSCNYQNQECGYY